MHTEHFLEAQETLTEVLDNPRFQSLPSHQQERWVLYRAYLNYALGHPIKIAGLTDLTNDIPSHFKDKSGYFAAAYILYALILLKNRDFATLDRRMEAIRSYGKRHLNESENAQSHYFLKLLTILNQAGYDPILASKKSKNAYQKLTKASADALTGAQVLPYDWLWNHILEDLAQSDRTPRQFP
jgi:hypothetical protein